MELEHSFTVPVPPEQAWQVLLDVERIAPCMPGASVDSVDGDQVKGRIKVKVGPVSLTYSGTARFVERDEQNRAVTLEASGKETRGAGTASATIRSTLRDEGAGQTLVVVHTTMNVTGRPAQFGRGVMAEVGGKVIERFAANLAGQLSGGDPAAAGPGADGAATGDAATGNGAGPGAAAPGQAAAGSGAAPAAEASPDGGGDAAATIAAGAGAADTGAAAAGTATDGGTNTGAAGAGTATDGGTNTGAAGAGTATDGGTNTGAAAHAEPALLEELRLPVRTYNSLRRVGIHTVAELTTRTEDELLAVENLGPASVGQIKQRLAERGLGLATAAGGGTGATAGAADGAAAAPPAASRASGAVPAAAEPSAGAATSGDAGTSGDAAASGDVAAGEAAASRGPAPATAPPWSGRPPDEDAIDLLSVAGFPVLKRALPIVGAVLAVLLIVLGIRRRTRG